MPNQIVGQNQGVLGLWMYLPDDILMHIFQFLPAASLLKAAQVRRYIKFHIELHLLNIVELLQLVLRLKAVSVVDFCGYLK